VGVTPPSAWPWLDHSVSGLPPATDGIAPKRPVQTRFRCAFAYRLKLAANGNSLTHYTKGTPSPHPYSRISAAPTACRHPVSGLFHSPLGVLFTFPSRYLCTIGHQGVFRLGGWSPRLRTGFHVSRPTQGSTGTYAYGAVTRSGRPFQTVPLPANRPLACSAFARHYSRNLG
jgi:hypothetical protein